MSDHTPTVVVIDDERTVQATLTAVLQRHGFAVEVAPNAAQGRRKVKERKPDLVLLDLELPDAGGLELLKELQSHATWAAHNDFDRPRFARQCDRVDQTRGISFSAEAVCGRGAHQSLPPRAGAAGPRRKNRCIRDGRRRSCRSNSARPRSSLRRSRLAGECVRWTRS